MEISRLIIADMLLLIFSIWTPRLLWSHRVILTAQDTEAIEMILPARFVSGYPTQEGLIARQNMLADGFPHAIHTYLDKDSFAALNQKSVKHPNHIESATHHWYIKLLPAWNDEYLLVGARNVKEGLDPQKMSERINWIRVLLWSILAGIFFMTIVSIRRITAAKF